MGIMRFYKERASRSPTIRPGAASWQLQEEAFDFIFNYQFVTPNF